MQSVFEAWREQIEAHERDMQALRGDGDEQGHGHGHGHGHGRQGGFGFTNRPLDPHRADDAALNGLFAVLGPGTEVLDVGGGSGRYALPLATRAKRVTVVEQSEDSVELLTSRAEEAGIDNITVINEAWEDAEAPTADMALCSLVLHHIAGSGPLRLEIAGPRNGPGCDSRNGRDTRVRSSTRSSKGFTGLLRRPCPAWPG